MREETKKRVASAGAALATACAVSALQAGLLGRDVFAAQLCATLVGLSWAPYAHLASLSTTLPKLLWAPVLTAWSFLCAMPVASAILVNLFTGHRVPGAGAMAALWRVLAILVLWMAFAVLNERVLRPWWREHSSHYFKFARRHSVAAQAQQLTMDKRAAALEAIKLRVVAVLKRKKLAERAVLSKTADLAAADDRIAQAQAMLQKAKERAEGAFEEDKEEAVLEVEAMNSMVEAARASKAGLKNDIIRAKLDVEDGQGRLDLLQHEWTEALHINNYTSFYR